MTTFTRTLNVAALALLAGLLTACGGVPPEQQAEEFISAVQPGMTWEQVIAIKAPRRWAVASSEAMGGHGQIMKFDEAGVRDGLANNGFGEGFLFQYKFTDAHAYQVWFDPTGKVSSVEKMRTMNDLLAP